MATEVAQTIAAPLLPAQSLRPDPRPIGEILVEAGFVNPEQLAEALSAQHLEDERVGETLVRLKYASGWQVCQALGRQFGMPCLERMKHDDV